MNVLTAALVRNSYARYWSKYDELCDLVSPPQVLITGAGKSLENSITEKKTIKICVVDCKEFENRQSLQTERSLLKVFGPGNVRTMDKQWFE